VEELTKAVRELVEAQREHSEILRQHSEQIAALVEAQRRTEEALRQHSEILRQHSEQIAALVEAQRRTEEALRQHSEILRQHSEQIAALIEAQNRTEAQIAALVEAQRRTWEELQRLVTWQRGEAGRREGERYERQVIRRAPAIFNGGQGGSPEQPIVQQRLTQLLAPFWQEGLIAPEDDPLLADLIWWKDEQIVVVEVSMRVDRYDVERAARGAATLRRAGAAAMGVVIGEEWATPETYDEAIGRQIEWFIGSEMSDGFREFRMRRVDMS
jgi:predicted RNase H-like HicB family nuclease